MSEFRFVHAVPVRFRDIDTMGHAHHTLPLIYIEEARTAYWRDVLGRDELDFIMGAVAVRYHARIRYPGTVHVAVRLTRLGGRSLAMGYEIRDDAGVLLADGTSEQVMYDYRAGATKPLPADLRERALAYEPSAPESTRT